MSEYGKEKPLMEILQELVTYCNLTCYSDVEVNLKLNLPRSTVEHFSKTFLPNERAVLSGEAGKPIVSIGKVRLTGGSVEFV